MENFLNELKKSFPVAQAIGLSNNVRHFDISNLFQQKGNDNSDTNALWCSLPLHRIAKGTNGRVLQWWRKR